MPKQLKTNTKKKIETYPNQNNLKQKKQKILKKKSNINFYSDLDQDIDIDIDETLYQTNIENTIETNTVETLSEIDAETTSETDDESDAESESIIDSLRLPRFSIFSNEEDIDITEYSLLTITIFPNNIFCTYQIKENDKLFLINASNSGKYDIKVTKKSLKSKISLVLSSFFKELEEKYTYLVDDLIIIRLVAPVQLKKIIINILTPFLYGKTYIFEVKENKIFNGCRAKKKIRKKRIFLRKFK